MEQISLPKKVPRRNDNFKVDARVKREKLENSRRFQYFRDADELESWILEKLQVASDESYKDPTILQAKIRKHQAFEAEVSAHSNVLVVLDRKGQDMINHNHCYQSDIIRKRLEQLHHLWEQLLSKLTAKGTKLQHALVLVQFLRQCDEVMFWINNKGSFLTSEECGHDLEHAEVLQRKFDEFQKDMASPVHHLTEVNEFAEKLLLDGHPDRNTIVTRKEELNNAWLRLKQMALMYQDKLDGVHEIVMLMRLAWIAEKDVVLSSNDYGRDLAGV